MSSLETIKPEQIHAYMLKMFIEFGEEVNKVAEKSTKKLAPKIKPELASYSKPHQKGVYVRGSLYRSGIYRTGWKLRAVKKTNIYQIKTYNAKKGGLVHLLEFGHKGRIEAKAYPHVRKTELKYLKLLMQDLEGEFKKI